MVSNYKTSRKDGKVSASVSVTSRSKVNNSRTPRIESFESVMERLKKTPSVSPTKRKANHRAFH